MPRHRQASRWAAVAESIDVNLPTDRRSIVSATAAAMAAAAKCRFVCVTKDGAAFAAKRAA